MAPSSVQTPTEQQIQLEGWNTKLLLCEVEKRRKSVHWLRNASKSYDRNTDDAIGAS